MDVAPPASAESRAPLDALEMSYSSRISAMSRRLDRLGWRHQVSVDPPDSDGDQRGTVVTAIVNRATREGLWAMRLDDIDLHTMAEEILEALGFDGGSDG